MKSLIHSYALLTVFIVISMVSCKKESFNLKTGDKIKFAVSSDNSDGNISKVSYSGTGSSTKERIDWNVGDNIRILCDAVSAPETKYADYQVNSVESPASGSWISKARIESIGDSGLKWGTGNHIFYATYPSPNISRIAKSITTDQASKHVIVSASLPTYQTTVGDLSASVANPDMNNMLMTAKSKVYSPGQDISSEDVFLNFLPLTTAVKFTITNQSKAPLTIKAVALTSASSVLSGDFIVDLDDETHQPAPVNLGYTSVTYSDTFPYCQVTGTYSDERKSSVISFASPVTLPYDPDITKCGSLTFTFFLLPTQHFNDLSFLLVKSDDSWMSTRLGYTDGTGVLFPQFKKTEIKGVMVPEGAQWYLGFGSPFVTNWVQGTYAGIQIFYP